MAKERYEVWEGVGKGSTGDKFARTTAVWDNKQGKVVKVDTEWLLSKGLVEEHIKAISPVRVELSQAPFPGFPG